MTRDMLEAVIKSKIKLFTESIALSAKRGLPALGLPDMLVTLTLWLKSGRCDFREWDNLCQQASAEWTAWYERTYY